MGDREAVLKAAGLWLLVQGLAHLFLNPGPRPVCGVSAPADLYPKCAPGDRRCEECERYPFEVLTPQIG